MQKWRTFQCALILIVLTFALVHCDKKPESYNECIIQNLKNATERLASEAIIEACERMFTSSIPIFLDGKGSFDSEQAPTTFTVEVQNPDASYKVTSFTVHVQSLVQSTDGKKTGDFSWTSNLRIQPLGVARFQGRWDGAAMQKPWSWYIDHIQGVKLR